MEFTPNRGDCLSIRGLLRDLAVFYEVEMPSDSYINDIDVLNLDFVNNAPNACAHISFLKIDIEGSEYRILDQIKNFAPSLNALVIEFHDCDLHFEKIKNFINNFKLQLVHIHANNFSLINSDNCPRAVELTFCTKEFTKNSINENKKFPTLLDILNNQLYSDLPIMFYND